MDTMDSFEFAELCEYFDYLDELRESGVTNMYGAAAYLIGEYDLEQRDARAVLSAWMKTFSRDKTLDERVAAALLDAGAAS